MALLQLIAERLGLVGPEAPTPKPRDIPPKEREQLMKRLVEIDNQIKSLMMERADIIRQLYGISIPTPPPVWPRVSIPTPERRPIRPEATRLPLPTVREAQKPLPPEKPRPRIIDVVIPPPRTPIMPPPSITKPGQPSSLPPAMPVPLIKGPYEPWPPGRPRPPMRGM
ncbi:MAG: hypothetical protein QXY32_01610 [Nitrososphaerota archaeon]